MLAPWKEAEFALPEALSERDGGDYRVVDYREERDIDARDAIKERRVKKEWVSTDPRRKQRNERIRSDAGILSYVAVGEKSGARFIVVYLHGRGGSREQGIDDWSFGGNFNRIKNLAFRNGGLYLSPDVDFGPDGAVRVAAMIRDAMEKSPGARVFVACGSAGAQVGYAICHEADIAERMGGFLLLGSFPDSGYSATSAGAKRVPVYIGHGSNDSVSPVANMESFYRSLRGAGIPARMVRFETGSHGTPIRMTDWREVLNWMAGR